MVGEKNGLWPLAEIRICFGIPERPNRAGRTCAAAEHAVVTMSKLGVKRARKVTVSGREILLLIEIIKEADISSFLSLLFISNIFRNEKG